MYCFRITTKRYLVCGLGYGKWGMSLKVTCLLENVMSVSFSWLNHEMAFEYKAVVTVQFRNVCSIESGRRQREHASSSTSLN